VYAIEKDPQVLACAKHNAEAYGVQDQISWYEGDCFEIIRHELVEMGEYGVVFASPPWGGRFIPFFESCLLIWKVLDIVRTPSSIFRRCSRTA